MSKIHDKTKASANTKDLQISPTIIVENNLDQHPIKFYDKRNFKYASTNITFAKNPAGEYKKKFIPMKEWQNITKCNYNKQKNGLYIVTGEVSGITVIDIDDIQKEEAKHIQDICDGICNYIVTTNKGKHFYFKYTNKIPTTAKKICGFDIRNDPGLILCPPSYYHDDNGNRYEYTFEKKPEDDEEFTEMPEELITFINKVLAKPFKKATVKTHDIKINDYFAENNTELLKYKTSDQLIKKLLDSINVKYADDYSDWIYVIWGLSNSGYGYEYWEYFSKRSSGYIEGANYEYYKAELSKYNNQKNKIQITISTIWYYLKIDNEDLFWTLQDDLLIEKQDASDKFDIDTYKIFNWEILLELYEKDFKYFGLKKYRKLLCKTRSYRYFNKFHFYVITHNAFYLKKYVGNVIKLKNIGKEISSHYKNINVFIEGKNNSMIAINFIDIFNTAKRAMYNEIDFSPNNDLDITVFNLFTGFKYDDLVVQPNMDKIQIFLDHMKYLCETDERNYDYLLKWCAHIVQQPWIKTNVAIVLYSETHGVGKNKFTELLGNIFEGYTGIFNNSDFEASFNSKFKNMLFMVGDEINCRAASHADPIKDMITRKEMSVKQKFVDEYTVNDYCNFIFTTNNEIAFKIQETDRRFMLIECPDQTKQNDYYVSLINAMNDNDRVRHFYYYLKNLDISEFIIQKIPITDYKKRTMLMSLPATLKFMHDECANYAGKSFMASELYKNSIDYARYKNLSTTYTDIYFYKIFKKVFGKYYVGGRNSRYNFDNTLTRDHVTELIMNNHISK